MGNSTIPVLKTRCMFPAKMKQFKFAFAKESTEHGGTLNKGKRKNTRPFCARRPIHLVLKAEESIFDDRSIIIGTAVKLSHRFGIRIYDLAPGIDHLHLVMKAPSREAYNKFIRALTGVIARTLGKNLWAQVPYTKFASWGRQYRNLQNYMQQNREEVLGKRPYKPRK
jgi:REP element-mobilizing transposase RayT